MISDDAHWHKLEHSGYTGDIPLWLDAADGLQAGSVCELGAGTGRVSHALAASGRRVLAVDSNAALLAGLRAGTTPGSRITTLNADLASLAPGSLKGYPLIIAPLLLVNLFGAAHPLESFFEMIRGGCEQGIQLAVATAEHLDPYVSAQPTSPTLPGSHFRSLVRGEDRIYRLTRDRLTISGANQVSTELLVPFGREELERAARPYFNFGHGRTIAASAMTIPMKVFFFNAT